MLHYALSCNIYLLCDLADALHINLHRHITENDLQYNNIFLYVNSNEFHDSFHNFSVKCMHFYPQSMWSTEAPKHLDPGSQRFPTRTNRCGCRALGNEEKPDLAVYILFSLSYGNNRCCPLQVLIKT